MRVEELRKVCVPYRFSEILVVSGARLARSKGVAVQIVFAQNFISGLYVFPMVFLTTRMHVVPTAGRHGGRHSASPSLRSAKASTVPTIEVATPLLLHLGA